MRRRPSMPPVPSPAACSPRAPAVRPLAAGLLAILLAASVTIAQEVAGGGAPAQETSAPEIAAPQGETPGAPEGREGLDPEVVALIESSVAAVKAEPGSREAWAELCMAFEANLLWPEAAECYQSIEGIDPSDAVWPLHRAIAELELGRIDSARARLEAALERDPALAPALERLGYVLLEQGDLDAARATFERLIEVLPESPAGYLGAGEVEQLSGRSERAAERLETALELDPLSAAGHYQLGLAYRALGRSEDASRELAIGLGAQRRYLPSPIAETVASYSVHLASQIDKAGALLAEGRDAEAAELLESLVPRAPDNPTLLNDLAVAYMRQSRLDEARDLLDRASKIDDKNFSTFLNLSAWAGYSGMPVEAVEFARSAAALAPSVAATHLALARALSDPRHQRISQQPMADRAEMLAEMERAITIGVDTPDVYLQLARELWREGRQDGAFRSLDDALARWPDFWPAELMRAWILVRSERFAEAAEAVEKVRAEMPEHPDLATLDRMIAEARPAGEG